MIFQRGKLVKLLVCDWRISIHFCFCFWLSVTIMIDGSLKHNRKFGFKLQSSRVIEKRYDVTFLNDKFARYEKCFQLLICDGTIS